MSFVGDPKVEAYAEERSTHPGELFERLAEETRTKTTAPQMMVGPIEGQFLATLVRLSRARRVLEIGTFTGYSTICMALALPTGGRIVTCDVNEETTAIARRYAEEAGVADRIDFKLGPATETLTQLDGPFDLVFIDADKEGYVGYYEAALLRLADNGLVVADNVLWSGRVLDDEPDASTRAIQRFNEHVRGDDRVVALVLTVRDGMTLIQRRPRA